jgi:hypothetical protein
VTAGWARSYWVAVAVWWVVRGDSSRSIRIDAHGHGCRHWLSLARGCRVRSAFTDGRGGLPSGGATPRSCRGTSAWISNRRCLYVAVHVAKRHHCGDRTFRTILVGLDRIGWSSFAARWTRRHGDWGDESERAVSVRWERIDSEAVLELAALAETSLERTPMLLMPGVAWAFLPVFCLWRRKPQAGLPIPLTCAPNLFGWCDGSVARIGMAQTARHIVCRTHRHECLSQELKFVGRRGGATRGVARKRREILRPMNRSLDDGPSVKRPVKQSQSQALAVFGGKRKRDSWSNRTRPA